MDVDLSGERAAAIDRAWQRELDLRARLLLNGSSEVRKEGERWRPQWRGGGLWAAPREVLEAAALERWPSATCIDEIVTFAQRLQRESGSKVRHLDPAEVRSLADSRLIALKAALREELTKDPTLSNGGLRERLESRGRSFGPLTSFDYHVANVRKELGIKGIRGTRPSNDRQVTPAAQQNGKHPVAARADAQSSTAQEPLTDSPQGLIDVPLPVAVAPATPAAAPEVPSYATRNPATPAAPAPAEKSNLISIDGDGGSFFATQEPDGSWKVELAAYLPEPLMAQLALVIWERVIGSPKGALA